MSLFTQALRTYQHIQSFILLLLDILEFLICNNYIGVILFPLLLFPSLPLSLLSSFYNSSLPHVSPYPYHHDDQKQMRLSSFLPLRLTHKLLYNFYLVGIIEKEIRQLLQCFAPTSKIYTAPYQATDFLFGLIR